MNILFIIGLLNFAAICRKGPERRSGDQKKDRNGVPVRSGSKRTLLMAHRLGGPVDKCGINFSLIYRVLEL